MTAAGFKKYVRPGVTVQVAETIRVDATLEVGATTDTVTVNAEAPLLKTESGELSHQIDYTEADDLPLFTLNGSGNEGIGNIRDPLSVLTTLPGADFSSDYEIRINGLPSGTQAIRVEGQDSTNGVQQTNSQAVQQSVDAIQEVSIQTSNFAAEYGQVGGGYINYTMKSGTNQYHGSAYDYFQNDGSELGLAFHGQHGRHRARQEPTEPERLRVHAGRTGKNSETVQRQRQDILLLQLRAVPPERDHEQSDCDRAPASVDGGEFGGRRELQQYPGPSLRACGVGHPPPGAGTPTGATDLTGQLFDPTTSHYVSSATRFRVRRNPVPEQHYSVQPDGSVVAHISEVFHRAHYSRTGRTTRFSRPSPTTGTPRFPRSRSIRTSARKSRYPGTIPQREPIRPMPMDIRTSRSRPRLRSNTRKPSASITTKPSRPPCCSIWASVFCTSTRPSIRRPLTRASSWVGRRTKQYPDNRFMPNLGGLSSFFDGWPCGGWALRWARRRLRRGPG